MIYQQNLFGPELELTDQPSFPEVSPASPFPWLESKKAKGTTVTYGHKCLELSPTLRQVGLLVRTYLESCELPGEQFVRTWSVRDTLSPYLLLKLRLSERRTGGSESRLWRTPGAADVDGRSTYATYDAYKVGRIDKGKQISLANQVKFPQLWATPTTNDAQNSTFPASQINRDTLVGDVMRLFATPNAAHAQGTSGGGQSRDLRTDVGGQLNPTWVEVLMGFPEGWTELED